MRVEQSKDFHLRCTSTVVLKRKQEMLYVVLDFENNLTVDALLVSRAYVSAVAQKNVGIKKAESPEYFS